MKQALIKIDYVNIKLILKKTARNSKTTKKEQRKDVCADRELKLY